MSILVDENTRLLVQGITGKEGQFHTRQCVEYGTNLVAGVTPGKGGQEMDGIPVFNTVEQARQETGANAAMIFVPPGFAADAIMEATASSIEVIVAITEGIEQLGDEGLELRAVAGIAHQQEVTVVTAPAPMLGAAGTVVAEHPSFVRTFHRFAEGPRQFFVVFGAQAEFLDATRGECELDGS